MGYILQQKIKLDAKIIKIKRNPKFSHKVKIKS